MSAVAVQTIAMGSRVRTINYGGTSSTSAMSPESAVASDLFDQFVSAGTFKAVLNTYRQICDVLQLKPTNFYSFYPRLKSKLRSWKAASLWTKLDKRASHKCYNRGKACPNTRVFIIGAGPCGLRTAIEAQLLGAKVVLVEKRDRFSRNNVLHLWPFVIHDLRNLGAKKFFGKFCAGSIDHISIRQLQLILLKVALLLGVEVHENVTFKDLVQPPDEKSQERVGWRAQVMPTDHPISQYEFDVIIGADGKRNTLKGFNRKEFRGKLAIAITANFINRHTLEEARVPEISGVAFIFNQKFFQDMREQTGIDLENIVYYKDDTHYFVMTAKKQSLLDRGVIINDYSDTASLLAPENVDRAALMDYARDAADFATNYQLPSLDFAVNHYGQADVAMFDFTSMYAAENACRVIEKHGYKLLQSLVGDSLLEPFWPTGSGCARGFLSSFDVAWMIRSWSCDKNSILQVLAERESVYRLLAQTTPENLNKDFNQYNLNPSSRYPNLNLYAVLPSQVRNLCKTEIEIQLPPNETRIDLHRKRRRRESIIHPDALLSWCQRQVALYSKIKIENMNTSWKDGLALCAIVHRFRPHLVDINNLNPEEAAQNNQLAYDILEREFSIPPVMTGQEMADCEVPDKLAMVSYISQIYEALRGEIPHGRPGKPAASEDTPKQQSGSSLNFLNRISQRLQNKKRYSIENESSKDKSEGQKRSRISSQNKRRSRDRGIASDPKDVTLTHYKKIINIMDKESFANRLKTLEKQMHKASCKFDSLSADESSSCKKARHTAKIDKNHQAVKHLQDHLCSRNSASSSKKSQSSKVGRLSKDEWNVAMLEERLKQQQKKQKEAEVERPKVFRDIFESKLQSMDARLKAGGGLTEEEKAKFAKLDSQLQKLNQQLKEGSLEVGVRGNNRVAAMADYMAAVLEKQSGLREPALSPPTPVPPSSLSRQNSCPENNSKPAISDICYFCQKRVYLMERLSAEGLFFHRGCFKCEYCGTNLRLGNYAFDRTGAFRGKFYCMPHFRMEKPSQRWQEMMKRKQAFLSGEPQLPILTPTPPLSDGKRTPSPAPVTESDGAGDGNQVPSLQVQQPLEGTIEIQTYLAPHPSTPALLTVESNIGDRDRTPERVEFENSLELTDEELLTSELEEEELTQKNLGNQDVPTSEDEYSDLSSDSASEEDIVERIERSYGAEETRQLAEKWQRKYTNDKEEESESSTEESLESESDEETETGDEDATSEDIDSDDEYSSPENNGKEETALLENKDIAQPDEKGEVTVAVPVLKIKSSVNDESASSSDSNLYISDEDAYTVSVSDTSDTESEPEPFQHEIPTIIIDETPGQQDTEQEWGPKEIEAALGTSYTSVIESPIAPSETEEFLKEKIESLVIAPEEKLHRSERNTSDKILKQPSDSLPTVSSDLSSSDTNEVDNSTVKILAEEILITVFDTALKRVSRFRGEENSLTDVSDVSLSGKSPKFVSPDDTSSKEDSSCAENFSGIKLDDYKLFVDKAPSSSSAVSSASNVSTPTDTSDSSAVPFTNLHKKTSSNSTTTTSSVSTPVSVDSSSSDFKAVESSSAEERLLSPLTPLRETVILPEESAIENSSLEQPVKSSWQSAVLNPARTLFQSIGFQFTSDAKSEKESKPKTSPPDDKVNSASSVSENVTPSSGTKSNVSRTVSSVSKASPNRESRTFDFSRENNAGSSEKSNLTLELEELKTPEAKDNVNEKNSKLSQHSHDQSIGDGSNATTCSASLSDQEVFSPDNISKLDDDIPVVCMQGAPLALAQDLEDEDDDDLTVSEWAKDEDGICALEDLDDSEELPFDDRFVTKRGKRNQSSHENHEYSWESPKNVCLPWVREDSEEILPIDQISIKSEEDFKSSTPTPTKETIGENIIAAKSPRTPTSKTPVMPVYKQGSFNLFKRNPTSDPSGEVCFKGYGGSFAEKVRPHSISGDSIYLKSLNINLQKIEFPSIKKVSGKMSVEDTSDNSTPRRQSSDLVRKNSQNRLLNFVNSNVDTKAISKKVPNVQARVEKSNSNPSQKSKEKRMSIHEDIHNLPYFDSQSLLGDDEDTFYTPASSNTHQNKNTLTSIKRPSYLECFSTPSETQVSNDLNAKTRERENARREARERARLKSDEELGLSPRNYRRRFSPQSPRVQVYDEFMSNDLLDDEAIEEEWIMSDMLDDCISVRKQSIQDASKSPHKALSSPDLNTTPHQDTFSPLSDFSSPRLGKLTPKFLSSDSSPDANGPCSSSKFPSKIKRKLWNKSEEEDKKVNSKRSLLSFLKFAKNNGESSSKEKGSSKELDKEKSFKSLSREKAFAKLKLSSKVKEKSKDKSRRSYQVDKADGLEVSPKKKLDEIKKHTSLDNLKVQTVVLPIKSYSVEFDCLAPTATEEDSLSEQEGNHSKTPPLEQTEKKSKHSSEKKVQKVAQRIHRQQELKRVRAAQEIQRRLEEVEVSLKDLEKRGVEIEKALRGESDKNETEKNEPELMQALFNLIRQKNKLAREEQELLIRAKDLELENRHCTLQQDMRERMAKDDKEKDSSEIEEEGKILGEMLKIVEKRDKLVALLDQLRVREEKEEKELESKMIAKGLQLSPVST